ncbi:hypothetical protein [Paracidovorax anthurii]|uniref:DUF2975 family protein n=1 Tax=Paracidovorax anthurii TaxID=78229 RepID=A0A328YBJ6_9BURK|nr:hypothetical protein [Paracidovorax anthurii]RAR71411.1 hypothetical protein AX018_11007 [Paracidovorax anthurii]
MRTVTLPSAAARPRAMRRIALLGWGTLLAGLLLPLATAGVLWRQPAAQWLARALPTAPDFAPAMAVPVLPWQVWAGVAVLAMAPVLVMGAALFWAGLGLLRIAAAQALSHALVLRLRRFAACTLAAAVLGTLCPALIGLVLSGALGGPLRLSLALDSRDLVLLLFAGVTWQLAAVLDEATAIADEHAQIV